MSNENLKKPAETKEVKTSKVVPLKDFSFKYGKEKYELVKGKEVSLPEMFLANLKTEKVIK